MPYGLVLYVVGVIMFFLGLFAERIVDKMDQMMKRGMQ
jgi:hypothetical protein